MRHAVMRWRGSNNGKAVASVELSGRMREVLVCLLMMLSVTLPLFLGGAHPLGTLWLHTLGMCAVLLWLGSLVVERRIPELPKWLWTGLGLGLGAGWIAAFNPSFVYRGAYQGFEALPFVRWLPSSVDGAVSTQALRHGTLMCLSLIHI